MTDTFVTFPMNENGVFWRPETVGRTLQDVMSAPFGVADVFVYSHGWATVGNSAMVTYGEYVIEFQKNLLLNGDRVTFPPTNSFGLGIHWPSTLSEDQGIIQKAFDSTTFYQMGQRAQQVGGSGVYAALSLLIMTRFNSHRNAIQTFIAANGPIESDQMPGIFRLTLLGHSFGCRVICSALDRICTELKKPGADPIFRAFVRSLRINAVLLQAAFKKAELDINGNYADLNLANLPNLHILITTSQLDRGLNQWFPLAENLNNLVHFRRPDAVALGSGIGDPIADDRALSPGGGPSEQVKQEFQVPAGELPLPVVPGLMTAAVPRGRKMLVADLTPIHLYHLQLAADQPWAFAWEEGGGSHSDISSPEIYNLINGFCFS